MEGNPPARDNFPPYKQALRQDCHMIKIHREASLTQNDLSPVPYNVYKVFTSVFFSQFRLFVHDKTCKLAL